MCVYTKNARKETGTLNKQNIFIQIFTAYYTLRGGGRDFLIQLQKGGIGVKSLRPSGLCSNLRLFQARVLKLGLTGFKNLLR